jgi:hypothetical protein
MLSLPLREGQGEWEEEEEVVNCRRRSCKDETSKTSATQSGRSFLHELSTRRGRGSGEVREQQAVVSDD